MRFSNPFALLLFLPAALAAAWNLKRPQRFRAVLPFPHGDLLDRTAAQWTSALWDLLPPLLAFGALGLMVLALARPQKVLRQPTDPNRGVDILLAIDTSDSMRALDFNPLSRMEAAKTSALDFIRHRLHDRIGIVVFASHAVLECPPTLDYESLFEFLDDVEPGMTHTGNTAIGDAIATAVNHLKASPAKSKVIILLTDGRSNTGYISDPLVAAKMAQSFGIKIYTIGTAGKGPAPYPVQDPLLGITRYAQMPEDLDEGLLTQIADLTGGHFFRATNLKELKGIYSQIDQLEKSPVRPPPAASYEDLALYFLAPAILMLLSEIVLTRTYLLRIP